MQAPKESLAAYFFDKFALCKDRELPFVKTEVELGFMLKNLVNSSCHKPIMRKMGSKIYHNIRELAVLVEKLEMMFQNLK